MKYLFDTEKVAAFLKTWEGVKFFTSLTQDCNRAQRNQRLKAVLNPPDNVVRYLNYAKAIMSVVKEKEEIEKLNAEPIVLDNPSFPEPFFEDKK